jgi:hypothetical protein
MVAFLIIVIGLILWSLRLLQGAIKLRDFSLILASVLVAVSAGGVIVVYALMDGCLSTYNSAHAALPLGEMTQFVPTTLSDSNTAFALGVSALSESVNKILEN